MAMSNEEAHALASQIAPLITEESLRNALPGHFAAQPHNVTAGGLGNVIQLIVQNLPAILALLASLGVLPPNAKVNPPAPPAPTGK